MSKYSKITKRYITAFEALFNNLTLTRTYKENDTGKVKPIKIPIEFANAEKEFYYNKINADLTSVKPSMSYPRLVFEIVKEELDNGRVLNKYNRYRTCQTGANGIPYLIKPPTPYILKFALYMYSDILDDSYEVAEKIKSHFNPSITMTILHELGLTSSCPVILDGMSLEDSYEGELSKRRVICYKFDFTVKAEYFDIPTSVTDVVKHIDLKYIPNPATSPEEVNHIDVVPDTAGPNDTYTITSFIQTL